MSATGWSRSGSWDLLPALPADPAYGPRRPRGSVDFVLFAAFTMAGVTISGFPVSELAAGLAVLVALSRPPAVTPSIGIVALMLGGLLLLMAYSAHENDLSPYRRLAHLALFAALSLVASQGRFHVGGMARGLAAGLLVSAGAYFLGYGEVYEGRLTGLLGDPNAAGYLLTTLGCLALAGMSTSRFRWPVGLLVLLAVVLTYSRTSMLATALVLAWLLLGRRVATLFGAVLLGLMIYVVTNVPDALQQVGPFADRVGSDSLRTRIVEQERVLISDAPWYGNGPGSSHVQVVGDTFFFHNSYLALQNEGGRLAVVLVVAVGVVSLLGLMRLPMAERDFWYEGALIALAVCAVNLGEVLLELPAALVVGMAVWHARAARQDALDRPPDRPRASVPDPASPDPRPT